MHILPAVPHGTTHQMPPRRAAVPTEAIDLWVSHWNDEPKPFVWTKTAEEIAAKVKRGRATRAHQIKSATDH